MRKIVSPVAISLSLVSEDLYFYSDMDKSWDGMTAFEWNNKTSEQKLSLLHPEDMVTFYKKLRHWEYYGYQGIVNTEYKILHAQTQHWVTLRNNFRIVAPNIRLEIAVNPTLLETATIEILYNTFNKFNDFILVFNDAGILEFANIPFLRETGFQCLDVLGARLIDLYKEHPMMDLSQQMYCPNQNGNHIHLIPMISKKASTLYAGWIKRTICVGSRFYTIFLGRKTKLEFTQKSAEQLEQQINKAKMELYQSLFHEKQAGMNGNDLAADFSITIMNMLPVVVGEV